MNMSNASRSALSHIPGLNKAIDFLVARANVVFGAQHDNETGAHTAITADSVTTPLVTAEVIEVEALTAEDVVQVVGPAGGILLLGGNSGTASNSAGIATANTAGLSIAVTDAAGIIRFYTNGVLRGSFDASGTFSLYDADGSTLAAQFDASGRNVWQLPSTANGTGNVTGNAVAIGRNSSGNGAAGYLQMVDKNGGGHFLWVDATGTLRISASAPPDEDGTPSDTSGTIVGTQT